MSDHRTLGARRTRVAWIAAIGLAACGPSSHGTTGPRDGGGTGLDADPSVGLVSIAVSPPMQTLLLNPGTTATAGFHATGTYMDGSTRDVTAFATWTLDNAGLGTISAGIFYSGANGGSSAVRAALGGVSGTAQVLVKVQLQRVESGAPSDAPALFGSASATPSLAPTIDYPYDGVLVPQNLGQLEVQWRNAGSDDLFQVAIESASTDVKVYTTSPKYLFEPDVWQLVASSNASGAVQITVSGMVAASPGSAGASTPVSVKFADNPVQGGIYYWSANSTDPTREGVFRYDFGAPSGSTATPYYTKALASGHCVACHVVSPDGTRMLVTYDGGNGAAGLIDVKSATALFDWNTGIHWNFGTFTPDGNTFVGSFGGVLTVYQVGTPATPMGTVPLPAGVLGATHPNIAPDGSQIVYTYNPRSVCSSSYNLDWSTMGDGIATVPLSGGTFGAPTIVLPADPSCAVNHYYPSYSPDAKWILFNESSGDTYNDPDAEVYLMPATGGTPMALANIDAVGPTNSWPRWSPFAGTFAGRKIYWITFSSQRDYGDEIVGAMRSQIWMAAVDLGAAASGADPSFPPFWLPFQDPTTPNHIAQWTTSVIK